MCSLSEYILAQLWMKQRTKQKIIDDHEIYSLYTRDVHRVFKLKIDHCIFYLFSFNFQSLHVITILLHGTNIWY